MTNNQSAVGAILAALVAGQAAHWFLGGEYLEHSEARNHLVMAQLIIGVVAGIWLLLRTRRRKASR
jgi:hypothetical protein